MKTSPHVQAFPDESNHGLSKREIFAVHAMAGLLANSAATENFTAQAIAYKSAHAADLLIEALNAETLASVITLDE